MSKIEWTEKTWNPIVGCSLASPGCTNCYAMKMAGRVEAMGHASYQGLTQRTKAGFVWTGKLGFNEKALLEPLKRKAPTMYFVNSMGDLFHEDCPDEWIDRVFAIMALCSQHTFQVLTKRSARMREYVGNLRDRADLIGFAGARVWGGKNPDGVFEDAMSIVQSTLRNVWLGVSVEDQARADERIPDLLATPAAVRWLSCEPLLGPVDLTMLHHDGITNIDALRGMHGVLQPMLAECDKIDWIVVGGESGAGARPMHPDWARSLRDQCAAAGVPFFFKQWGEWLLATEHDPTSHAMTSVLGLGEDIVAFDGAIGAKIGKKRAGRLLDGQLHDAMPEAMR